MSQRQAGTMKMHESAALLLCRSAFIALGFLPVLIVILWSTAELIPVYRNARAARWQAAISAHLGVAVEIATVSQVAPRRFILDGVALRHPETNQTIAHVPQATVWQVGEQWSVRCSSGEVSLAEMPQLWDTTHDWVLCRPGKLSGSIVVGFDQLLIAGPNSQYAFGRSQLALLPGEDEQRLHISLSHADTRTASLGLPPATQDSVLPKPLDPASVTVSRKLVNMQPQTTISIDSRSTSLPCSLAFGLAPQLAQLGDKAKFQGTVVFTQMQHRWGMWINEDGVDPQSGRVRFRDNSPTVFSCVEFGRLTDGMEANVRGEGTLTFDRAYLADYGVQEADGTLVVDSQQNSISAIFLKHACFTLGLRTNVEFAGATPGMIFAFSKLAVQYRFADGRLWLRGGDNGALLVDSQDQPRVVRGGPEWQQSIAIDLVATVLDRTAAEAPASASRVEHRDPGRLARRWLPVRNSPLATPTIVPGDQGPRTQTASTAIPNTH